MKKTFILLLLIFVFKINLFSQEKKDSLKLFPSFNITRTYFGVMPYFSQSLELNILEKNKFNLGAGVALNGFINSFTIEYFPLFNNGNYGGEHYNATKYYLFSTYKIGNKLIGNRFSLFGELSVKNTFDDYDNYLCYVGSYIKYNTEYYYRSDLFGSIGTNVDMHNGIYLKFNLTYKIITLKDHKRKLEPSYMGEPYTYVKTITPYNIIGFGIGYNFSANTKTEKNKEKQKYYIPKNNIGLFVIATIKYFNYYIFPLYYERRLFIHNRYVLSGGTNFCYNYNNKSFAHPSKTIDYGILLNNKIMILKNTGIELGLYYKYYNSPINNSNSQLTDFIKNNYHCGLNYGLSILIKKHYMLKIKHSIDYYNYNSLSWQGLDLSIGYAFGY